MKPTSRHQLAKFLDQVRSRYPYGIARNLIVAPPPSALAAEEASTVRYRFIVGGASDSLTPPQRELLDGIITKGLKLSPGDYDTAFAEGGEPRTPAGSQRARCTISFGAHDTKGVVTTEDGSTVLHTWQLQEILDTPSYKRELWRSLQELISRGL